MIEEHNSILFDQFLHTLKAPEIDNYKRAEIIKEHLVINNLSIREFSRIQGLCKSTVEDWLLPLRVSKTKYFEMLKENSKKDVYIFLRGDRIKNIIDVNQDVVKIKVFIQYLKSDAHKKFSNDKNFALILDELKKAVSYFEFKVERKGGQYDNQNKR